MCVVAYRLWRCRWSRKVLLRCPYCERSWVQRTVKPLWRRRPPCPLSSECLCDEVNEFQPKGDKRDGGLVYAFKMRRLFSKTLFRKCRRRFVMHAPACRQLTTVSATVKHSPAHFWTNPSIRRHGCPQELMLPPPHAVEDAHKSGDRRHQQHQHCQDHRLTGHFGSSGSTGALLKLNQRRLVQSSMTVCIWKWT